MALSEEVKKQYKPAIGIECHVQLKTKTKLFSAVSNDARNAKPNTLISHIDAGLPGALPVLNEQALNLAVRAAFALNTRPQKHSYFERKHYFYPDSPAGYQISQLHAPIIIGGSVDIEVDGQKKTIGINRAQLEADAGKTIHPAGTSYSLVDLNRAGTPLLEIVSQPDINSAAEAKAYARELYLLMKYADVSDVDLYHGNMRFDVNVSVSKDDKLGIRSEVKNLNSFRSVENAVNYEIGRQIEMLERGEKVIQETRGWDDDKQKTTSQRSKEEAHDYRYMPEPDIPPIELDDKFIEKIKTELPRLPAEWRKILNKSSIPFKDAELLIESEAQDLGISYLSILKEIDDVEKAKKYANWFVNLDIPMRQAEAITSDPEIIKAIYEPINILVVENKINSTKAKELISDLSKIADSSIDVAEYAHTMGYIQVSDKSAIEKIVAGVIKDNPKAAADVRNGEAKAIGFLVGQVMAKSKGQANPQLAQQNIKKQLGL